MLLPSLESHHGELPVTSMMTNLVVYERCGSQCLDESQHRTHRILQVEKDDLPFLKTQQVDASS